MTTENSSLFSLEQLTRAQAAETATSDDDDSGLIDINRLAALGPSATNPAYHQAPPPLGLAADGVEEATLTGVTAVAASPSASRWLRVSGYVAVLGLVSAVLGLALDKLSRGAEEVAAPAGTTVIVVTAPAVQPEPGIAGVVDARERATHEETATTQPGHSELGGSNVVPPRAAKPSPRPIKPTIKSKPAAQSKPAAAKPKKQKDPCARCSGDLACAMRCSVGK